jgi:hypothetical protein
LLGVSGDSLLGYLDAEYSPPSTGEFGSIYRMQYYYCPHITK